MVIPGRQAKTKFRPQIKLEVFYTGGAVAPSPNGFLACACGQDVKASRSPSQITFTEIAAVSTHKCIELQVVAADTGKVTATLSGVRPYLFG